jgi:DNA-binding NarL/FixJ family response regulator
MTMLALPGRWELSPRQSEVLALIEEGYTDKEIARQLALHPETVKVHAKAVLRRMGARNRTHAAVMAVRARLAPAELRRMWREGSSFSSLSPVFVW